MKNIDIKHIIDQGLVVVLALIIAAIISYTGGSVLAIAHMQPFHQCIICDVCDADSCER